MALGPTQTPGDADRAGEGSYLSECGSSEPVPNDEVEAHQDGSVDVLMRCEEKGCANTSEMAVVLSPEEAKALGLHSLGERPEVP